MFQNHTHVYINKIKKVSFCGNNNNMAILEVTRYTLPFEIEVFRNEKHNLNNCQGCKKHHDVILGHLENFYSNFPNCCIWHKKLLQLNEFNKADFSDCAKQISNKTMATFHHIINHIHYDNYITEITNYLEYVIISCGSFPKGHGVPFGMDKLFKYLDILLRNYKFPQEDIVYEKRMIHVYQIIESLTTPQKNNKKQNRDLNLVIDIYNRWFEIFPFSIEFFKHLKARYSKNLPIMEEDWTYNPYLKTSKNKIITSNRLIQFLNEVTVNVLNSVDTPKMLEDDYITDKTKYNIDIIKDQHSLEQKLIFKQFTKGEKRYVKTIKKWLENEKKFIKEIMGEISDVPNVKESGNNPKIKNPPINNSGFTLVNGKPTDSKFGDFHNSLKLIGFIDVDLPVFRNAFFGKKNYNAVNWLGTQQELNYLINKIHTIKVNKVHDQWKRVTKMFRNEKGESFNANYLKTNKYKGIHHDLDTIIENL